MPVPALLIFVYFIEALLYKRFIFVWNYLNPLWKKQIEKIKEFNISIPPFINVLTGYDQLKLYSKLLHKRKTIGILQHESALLESLRTFKAPSDKYLSGSYDYDILSN